MAVSMLPAEAAQCPWRRRWFPLGTKKCRAPGDSCHSHTEGRPQGPRGLWVTRRHHAGLPRTHVRVRTGLLRPGSLRSRSQARGGQLSEEGDCQMEDRQALALPFC